MSDVLGLPDAILVADATGHITAANTEASRLTGHPRDALLGASLVDLLDPRARDGTPLLDGGWHASARLPGVTRIPEQDVTISCSRGRTRRVYATGRYVRRGRELTGAVLALRDAERRSKEAAAGIEIVSTVSHELRSPLTSVKGYTSLLLNRWDRIDDDQKRMMLGQVHHDADRVTRLVSELLDISRLETGRLVLRREDVDLRSLATSVVEKVGMEYPELQCEVDVSTDVPNVYADPDKVEQVLTNLLENAVKYASPVGMRIEARSGDDFVTVSVSDAGEGIPEKDLPRVFTKFFRRDQGRPTGSGLGLWISRGLAEAHGGELTATSIPGEGTTFSFTLPSHAFEELLEQGSSGD